MTAIVDEQEIPIDCSFRIRENYENFRTWLDDYGHQLEIICRGISKLIVVDIALTSGEDNPQLIFESMNSTGKELTQADLIRNYILMGLDIKEQSYLYEHYWRPMETNFGQEAYTTDFDGFMRHYLTLKTGKIPRINEVYDAFKEYSGQMSVKEISISMIC